MELPLGDRAIIQRAVESMYEVVDHILVVVSWNAARVRQLLAGYEKARIVENPNYQAGMFSSVQAGVAGVCAPCFFLLPGDTPLVSRETYRRLLQATGEIRIPVHLGRKGHPVLMSSRLIPEILGLPREMTLRDFVARKGYSAIDVDDEGVVTDVDTLEDYHHVVSRWETSERERWPEP